MPMRDDKVFRIYSDPAYRIHPSLSPGDQAAAAHRGGKVSEFEFMDIDRVNCLVTEPWRKRVEVAGVLLNHVTTAQVLQAIADYALRGEQLRICTVNVDFAIKSRNNQRFHDYIYHADIATADGKPVLWAAKFLGEWLPEKVSGSDLIFSICEMAAKKGLAVYLLGAMDPVASEAAARLQNLYPGLKIAGAKSPDPLRHYDVRYNLEICEEIRLSGADILMVGFGCPKQEFWIEDYQELTGAAVAIGVGASIDFAAGRMKRAPVWMQQVGLEWFFRLCQEPSRLWKRYLVDDPPFFWYVLLQKLALDPTPGQPSGFFRKSPTMRIPALPEKKDATPVG